MSLRLHAAAVVGWRRWARRGVGRMILAACERAAAGEGFTRAELMATMAGVPLYRSFGFIDVRPFEDSGVPMMLMRKAVA